MDPVSLPVSRPRPLYPMASCRMLLFVEPPKYGRSAAGVSSAARIHQPAPTMIPTPISTVCQIRLPSLGGPAHR